MTLYIAGIIALQMYPGRRFALPWAISFCPFGAAGSMVDCYLPGPSTPAEGVPALRAYGHRMLLTGAFDPGKGCASPSGLCGHKVAIYRGLLEHFQAFGK
jgi:hypothetical protein